MLVPTSPGSPPPPILARPSWSRLRFGRQGGSLLCVDCTLTFATRALLNSAAWLHQRSSTFPLEARIGFAWRFGDEVRAATGRRRSATIVSTHNLLQKLSVQKGLYVPLYVPAGREALRTRQVREATITEKASQAAQA